MIAATGGIALFYLVEFVLGFFGVRFAAINGSGALGIGINVFVVLIAALNLVLDFDFIENGARAGAPKYMEWYAAFGLMVTLVWLYLEILRLLSKINSREGLAVFPVPSPPVNQISPGAPIRRSRRRPESHGYPWRVAHPLRKVTRNVPAREDQESM